MPSYNTASVIEDSIKSVMDQTYDRWELIIVDDYSTDGSDKVIESFLYDKRIIYIRNDENLGAAISRNRAIQIAKGRWIAFLDSDDIWLPEKLEHQIQFMNKNEYHFSYTNYAEIDSNGIRNGIRVSGPKRIGKTGFHNYCWPGCLTVMFDQEYIGKIRIADIKKNNDYAMWLKVCKKAKCYLLDEELALYRRGRIGSVSSHSVMTMLKWHYKLFKEAEGQNSIIALISTFRNALFGFYKKLRYVSRD